MPEQHIQDVAIRPFEAGDFEPLAMLMNEVWGSGGYSPEEVLADRIVLASYLVEHDWGLVAEHDGVLVGAILAGLRQPHPDALWTDKLTSLWEDAGRKDATLPARLLQISEVEVAEAEVTRRLKAEPLPQADATIQLLILSEGARGKHLGTHLLDSALAWMRSQNARGYFLMTDDECDVGFYDHRGIPRLETKQIEHEGRPFGIYAYGDLLA